MPLANRPVRQVHGSFHPFRWIALFLIPSTVLLAEIEPVEITLQPSRTRAIAVRAPNPSWLVTIHMGSGEPTGAIAADPDRPLPLAGFDKTTRLCIFASPSDSTTKITGWSGKFPARSAGKLTIREPGNSRPCRFNNWTYQIGRKVLPLALPTVSFQGNPPIQGSPVMDSSGKIIGLILKPADAASAYLIPAEAVHRVLRDMAKHRQMVRGWLGFSLSTESDLPEIMRVWPDSPAAQAGLHPGDILLKAGGASTRRYQDAVNAFFYTVPGEPILLQVSRGATTLTAELTPRAAPPGP